MIENASPLHSVTLFISRYIFYILLAVLAINMLQRRHQQHSQKKRMGTFYLGVLILVFMVGTVIIVYFSLPDLLILPLAAAVALLGYLKRKTVFPFHLSCSSCGEPLSGKRILYFDSNTCERCEPSEPSERGEGSGQSKQSDPSGND